MDNINKIEFFQHNKIEPMHLNASASLNADEVNKTSFKDVVSNMMNELNEVTQKPQEMTNAAMQGKADIHDVMSAIAQSNITVQAATTITGKILQTYEKIMQIQI